MYDDIFHYGETKNQRKRRILKENVRRGKAAEETAKFRLAVLEGWNLKKTGRGSDSVGTRTI